MIKTGPAPYANRQNAIRAARKALGADTKPDEHFTIEAIEGGFAWAKIETPAVSAPPQGFEATTTYQAEMGAPNRGEYRRTPEGEPSVADLVRPGMLVRSSYGTGGVVRSVSGPHPLLWPQGEGLETYSIEYGKPGGAKTEGHINELVAVGGRILKLFVANPDEVFFEEAPPLEEPEEAPPVALAPVGGLLAGLEAAAIADEAYASERFGVADLLSKPAALARIASEILNVHDMATDMRHGLAVTCNAPVKDLRAALAAAYEAGHAARARKAAARAGQAPRTLRGPGRPREGSKLDTIVALLTRESGTTTREILDATGWPAVSVPQQAKAAGLELRKDKQPGQPTRYFGAPLTAA